jgi:hypothetical protein
MLFGTGSVATAFTAAGRIGRLVSCVLKRSSCRSTMLRQEELAFFKALSTLSLSPAVVKELRMVLSRRKKRPVVPAVIRGTTSGGEARALLLPSGQLAGKRKSNELASSGVSFEPANWRPASNDGSTPLPASAPAVTGEEAATCSRQRGSPEGGATYTAVLVGPVAPSQLSGPLTHTPVGSDPSEPAISSETANRCMSSDMSGPLSGKPDAPLQTPRWPTPVYQQKSVLIRCPFLLQVLVTHVPSWPNCGSLALAV